MDIQGLMRQAQEMQKKMQKAQEELANKEYEGNAGGGLVKVVITGGQEVKKIDIDSSLFNPEEKEVLEDLLIAAINNAKSNVEDDSKESLKSLTGGISLPPGFKV